MGLCSKCADKSCHWYGSGAIECLDFKPETSGDRIRAMSDEELAEFLLDRDLKIVEKASKAVGFTYKVDREQCLVNVIDWLKQDAE